MHAEQGRTGVHHVHAVGGEEQRYGAAAAHIDLAQFRHLPGNVSGIEHAAHPAEVFRVRVVGAVFSPGARELAEGHAVAEEGGIGVIAGAMIGMKEPDVAKNPIEANLRALRQELTKAREKTQGIIGVNIMVALTTFSQMVRTAIENRADIIFSGAGLPLEMPKHLLQACEEKKEDLEPYALYQAVCLEKTKEEAEIFLCSSQNAEEFAKTHAEDILYLKYLQFLAFGQLERACRELEEKSEGKTGFYMDIAVGTAGRSAEVYGQPELYMKGVAIGSPPDFFNIRGQDWGLAPMNPLELSRTGFRFMRRLFARYMSCSKAVRLDHVFSLERLFLQAPDGMGGAYLRYPFYELSGILALESHRNKCLVIGEDLGTSPEGFFDKMQEQKIFCFRIFRYEKRFDSYLTPFEYETDCTVVTGTHDMSPFPSFWRGTDLKFLEKFGGWDEEKIRFESDERAAERKEIILALAKQGIFFADTVKEDFPILEGKELPSLAISAVYRFLSEANSKILLIQLEDVFGQEYQVNVPGTTWEYPNWRYKLEINLEDFPKQPSFEKVFQTVHKKR